MPAARDRLGHHFVSDGAMCGYCLCCMAIRDPCRERREAALIVGIGGVLSLPLGGLLAVWLDGILKRMPGIPAQLHFFVFQPEALAIHAGLLLTTAFAAALYPMHLVARLPIAATLRNEAL